MIIVKDIQDAITLRKSIKSLVRRSVAFNKSKEDILIELMMMVEDLDKNVEKLEEAMVMEMAS